MHFISTFHSLLPWSSLKSVKVLDFAFLSSVEFKVTFFLPRRDKSISKLFCPGQTDKLPNQHSAVSALLSGMGETKSEDVRTRKVGKERGGEKEAEAEDDCKQIHILQPKKSFTQGNVCAINYGENAIVLVGP